MYSLPSNDTTIATAKPRFFASFVVVVEQTAITNAKKSHRFWVDM